MNRIATAPPHSTAAVPATQARRNNQEQQRAQAAATQADPRWAALLARSSAADGQFWYSVQTTGVYCRPGCAARTPRPENVRFHASCEAAEQAGFRPCQRCRPRQPTARSHHGALVAEVCRIIDRHEGSAPTRAALAAQTGLSASHLQRIFSQAMGLTPAAYAAARRAQRLRSALAQSPAAPVTEAIYGAGYQSSSRFYEQADQILGMTPARYRAGGAQTEIRYAVGACALGAILVAHSARGVCAIALGDDGQALVRELHQRFARATLLPGDGAFAALLAQVVAFVEAPGLGLELPLDLRGTAFQQRVWQALRAIAPGQTASYAEIAARLGAPKAARAVARACAANPLAVAIPCHRVLRSDGAPSGYRWGLARKQTLLAREADALQARQTAQTGKAEQPAMAAMVASAPMEEEKAA